MYTQRKVFWNESPRTVLIQNQLHCMSIASMTLTSLYFAIESTIFKSSVCISICLHRHVIELETISVRTFSETLPSRRTLYDTPLHRHLYQEFGLHCLLVGEPNTSPCAHIRVVSTIEQMVQLLWLHVQRLVFATGASRPTYILERWILSTTHFWLHFYHKSCVWSRCIKPYSAVDTPLYC